MKQDILKKNDRLLFCAIYCTVLDAMKPTKELVEELRVTFRDLTENDPVMHGKLESKTNLHVEKKNLLFIL